MELKQLFLPNSPTPWPAPIDEGFFANSVLRRLADDYFVFGMAVLSAVPLILGNPKFVAALRDHGPAVSDDATKTQRIAERLLWHIGGSLRGLQEIIFADSPTATRAAELLRSHHRDAHGTLGAGFAPYPATEPYDALTDKLMNWVLLCILYQLAEGQTTYGRVMSRFQSNQLAAESRGLAELLKLDSWSIDCWDDLERELQAGLARDRFVVGSVTRQVMDMFLVTNLRDAYLLGPWSHYVIWRTSLPVRAAYGIKWSDTQTQAAGMLVNQTRGLLIQVPGAERLTPYARRQRA